LFVKGNEGALLAYFSKKFPPKCDAESHQCMPSQIVGAIYTATLRVLKDQILMGMVPGGGLMSQKILLETVPLSHNQLRVSMSQMVADQTA
jgi:hypothetical protein